MVVEGVFLIHPALGRNDLHTIGLLILCRWLAVSKRKLLLESENFGVVQVLQCSDAISLGAVFPQKLVIYVQVFVTVTESDVFLAARPHLSRAKTLQVVSMRIATVLRPIVDASKSFLPGQRRQLFFGMLQVLPHSSEGPKLLPAQMGYHSAILQNRHQIGHHFFLRASRQFGTAPGEIRVHPNLHYSKFSPSDHLLADVKGAVALMQVLEGSKQVWHFGAQAKLCLPATLVAGALGHMLHQHLKVEAQLRVREPASADDIAVDARTEGKGVDFTRGELVHFAHRHSGQQFHHCQVWGMDVVQVAVLPFPLATQLREGFQADALGQGAHYSRQNIQQDKFPPDRAQP